MKSFLKPQYPVVRQYDQIDCAPACLLSVLKFYGGDAGIVQVRDLCQTDIKGSTMLDVVRAAESLGFQAVGATGDYEDLMEESMPCIAHVVLQDGFQHFIVVYRIDAFGVLVGDPATGLRKYRRAEFEEIWKQKAVILLTPTAKVFNSSVQGWFNWVAGYLKKSESWVIQTVFLGIGYTALGLMTALFVQWLLDRFIPQKEIEKILYTGLVLLFLLSIRSLTGFFRQRFLVVLNKKVSIAICSDFLDHLFKIPKRFFDTRKTGDITARINDSMRIQQAILMVTNVTIIDGLVILGSLALMYYLAPGLAWFSMVAVPVYGLLLFRRSGKIKIEQSEVMKGYAKVESSYIDTLQGIDDIIGLNTAQSFADLNKGLFGLFQNALERLGLTRASLSFTAECIGAMLTIGVLTAGAILVVRQDLHLGAMMAAYSLLANILPAVVNLVSAFIALQGASVAAQRLRDLLLVQPEKNAGTMPFMLDACLSICAGSFGWPKSKPLLNRIDITIERGRLTSLWGESGSGKSTIVQLLQRKYPLNSGNILVDGIRAEQFDLAMYRSQIGVVPQRIKIFNATLLDNILLGRRVSHADEVIHTIDFLGLTPFYNRFEQGLFTMLGEDGRELSGGERQVLALTRALLWKPEVLIVDEGFSFIDVDLESMIFAVVQRYAFDHAVLIITHDLPTILQTDFVYLLAKGSIIDRGHPQELLDDPRTYLSQLWNREQSRLRPVNSTATTEFL
jgi:ATP-binding cassette subfamily B protein